MIYSINDSRLLEGWLLILWVAVLVFFVARNTAKRESLKFNKNGY